MVWVGTGEAHLGGMSYDGTGVFRSQDGGETWRNMGLVDSARIGKVLVHPSSSEVVHVAVIGPRGGAHEGRGVHVSRDGGETWERTLHAGPHVGIIDLVRCAFEPHAHGDVADAYRWRVARAAVARPLVRSSSHALTPHPASRMLCTHHIRGSELAFSLDEVIRLVV